MASGASEGSYAALIRPLQPLPPEIDGDTHKEAAKESKKGVAGNKAVTTEDEPDDELQRPSKDKEREGGGGDDSTGEGKGAGKASKHPANNKANTAKKNSDGDLSGDQLKLRCVFDAKRESLLKHLQSPILGCAILIHFFIPRTLCDIYGIIFFVRVGT